MPPSNPRQPDQKHPFGKGAKVTFTDLLEPIMTVEAIDWTSRTAICRYKDAINQKNNHLTCNPNDLIAVNANRKNKSPDEKTRQA